MKKLLIANRGEIAARIIRTARRMGLTTVAVFSDADADAPYVRAADLAVRLPGRTSAETYLRGDLIIEAAQRTGADAIHPGYGFLSENPGFARSVAEAGITWVGPTAEQIEAMALKVEAKQLAEAAGVPLVPGAELDSDDDAAAAGAAVGFPLLVKASAGGGGKGMRLVTDPADLVGAVEAARREAQSAFGDPTVFLERYLSPSRHVEVQVFGDTHGNVVHLFERECSIQRRHQKVVEEAPSPGATDATREQMYTAATALAAKIGYLGAGTVEFLVAGAGESQEFFFLEMNTRLQVEHPVTEATTGVDLVEWQLRVAQGEPLPATQRQITRCGAAIEVRLYAEDPANGYLPNTGRLELCEFPVTEGIRVDTGVTTGSDITPLYDPMIAKVIGVGADRDQAAGRLASYLRGLPILGVRTNRESLAAILDDADYRAGATTTDYLEHHPDVLAPELSHDTRRRAVLAAIAATRPGAGPILPGWRNVPAAPQFRRVAVDYAGSDDPMVVRWRGGEWEFCADGEAYTAEVLDAFAATATGGSAGASAPASAAASVELDGIRTEHDVLVTDGVAMVAVLGTRVPVQLLPRFTDAHLAGADAGPATPVPGTVTAVLVEPGAVVSAGDPLVILEAMKMEHKISADTDGVVEEVLVSVGQSVDAHQVVVVLQEAE